MKYNPMLAQTIGEFCKLIRLRQEMNQAEFAKYLDVSTVRVSQVENDNFDIPTEYLKSIEAFVTDDEFEFMMEMLKRSLAERIRG